MATTDGNGNSPHPNDRLRRLALRSPSQRYVPTIAELMASLANEPGSTAFKRSFATVMLNLIRMGLADYDPETQTVELVGDPDHRRQ